MTPPLKTRLDRLLELLWEDDREPVRLELGEDELRALERAAEPHEFALTAAGALYRGVEVAIAAGALLVWRNPDGRTTSYGLAA